MAVEDFKVYTQDSGWVSLAQTLPQGTSEGQLLHWDGTQWAAASDGTADGQYLVWNDTAKRWEPGTHETGNLPIQSDDGTVVLDSPNPNTFSINIGASQRVIIDADSADFEGTIKCNDFLSSVAADPAEIQLTSNIVFECLKLSRFNANGTTVVEVNGEDFSVGINSVATDKAGLTVKTKVVNPTYGTQGVWSNGSVSPSTQAGRFFDSFLSQPIIAAASSCEVIHFRAFDNAASTTTGSHAGFFASGLTASTTKNYGFWSQVALEAGKTNYAFFASSSAPSYFNGDIITSTIRSKDDKEGSIVLNENLVLDGQTVSMNVGDPAKNITFGSNTSDVAGGDGIYFLSRNHDLAFSSNEIRFNSNWSGGANVCHWLMKEDGGFVAYNTNSYIRTPHVKGLVDTDAQIDLGSQAEIKNGDGSEYVPLTNDSIPTKKYVDDVIWVGTQAEYDALGIYDNKRLYCITD